MYINNVDEILASGALVNAHSDRKKHVKNTNILI